MGTPLYMSPEQAEGKMNELDAASDQFSLAAMVYEMLTGKPAFSGDTLASIAYQVVHATPVPARTHRPSLPAEVENVVSRALAKNKRDRFSSVAEFAVHLRWTASLAANRTPAPQLAGPATDGEPTLVVNSPDDPTPVSTLPSGMAAVLRETIGGGSGTGATVAAAPRRWRVVLVSALFGGALALAAGLLTRPRAPERTHATPAPASATAAPPTARARVDQRERAHRGRRAGSRRRRRRTMRFLPRAWEDRHAVERARPPNVPESRRARKSKRPRSRRRWRVRPRVAC